MKPEAENSPSSEIITAMKNSFSRVYLVLLLFLTASTGSFAGDTAVDFFNQGNAKRENRDLDGAIADYTRAIEINPKLLGAYGNRGYAKNVKGDLDGAIADYTRVIEINPKLSYAYFTRGNAKQAKGDLDGAIADFTRCIEINPKSLESYSNRGYAKQAKGDLDGAIADYNRTIEINPKYSEAYFGRGYAKRAMGEMDGAIADYNHAIEINPKYSMAYYGRGNAKKAKGDLDGAMADYNQVIEINPKISEAYYGLALCNHLKSNWTDALSYYRRASELTKQRELQDYCQLHIWIIRSRFGEGQAADKELAAHLDKGGNAAPNDWVTKLAKHLHGTVTEADLIVAAESPDARKKSGQVCEAWYYAGMKKLLAGDKKAAADFFRKCIDTKRNDFTEFIFAQAELKALGGE